MLNKLNVYQIICDKCGGLGSEFIAADSKENAKVPFGWTRKVENGEHQHVCGPCSGNAQPDHHDHEHAH